MMTAGTAQKISNAVLSCAAGVASFLFSLTALLYLTEFDQKIVAALAAGVFCLLVSYVAAERPNSESARALVGAQRAAPGGRGRRPRVARAGSGPAQHAQARRGRRQPVRRGSRIDRECPRAGHVRSGDLAAQPAAFPRPRPTS